MHQTGPGASSLIASTRGSPLGHIGAPCKVKPQRQVSRFRQANPRGGDHRAVLPAEVLHGGIPGNEQRRVHIAQISTIEFAVNVHGLAQLARPVGQVPRGLDRAAARASTLHPDPLRRRGSAPPRPHPPAGRLGSCRSSCRRSGTRSHAPVRQTLPGFALLVRGRRGRRDRPPNTPPSRLWRRRRAHWACGESANVQATRAPPLSRMARRNASGAA